MVGTSTLEGSGSMGSGNATLMHAEVISASCDLVVDRSSASAKNVSVADPSTYGSTGAATGDSGDISVGGTSNLSRNVMIGGAYQDTDATITETGIIAESDLLVAGTLPLGESPSSRGGNMSPTDTVAFRIRSDLSVDQISTPVNDEGLCLAVDSIVDVATAVTEDTGFSSLVVPISSLMNPIETSSSAIPLGDPVSESRAPEMALVFSPPSRVKGSAETSPTQHEEAQANPQEAGPGPADRQEQGQKKQEWPQPERQDQAQAAKAAVAA